MHTYQYSNARLHTSVHTCTQINTHEHNSNRLNCWQVLEMPGLAAEKAGTLEGKMNTSGALTCFEPKDVYR